MSKWSSLKILCFVLLTSLPAVAQTSSDLERKYGKRENQLVKRIGFEVRPGIIMTASYASDGQVCEVVIEPKRVTESGIDLDRQIPTAVMREIVDEIVAPAQRGRELGGIRMGNYTTMSLVNYDKLPTFSVLVGVGRPEADLKIDEIRIKWKDRQCHQLHDAFRP